MNPTDGDIFVSFRQLNEHNTLQSYFTQKYFNTCDEYPANDRRGYTLYVYDIHCHQELTMSQCIEAKVWNSSTG